jgi:hypothetical protein
MIANYLPGIALIKARLVEKEVDFKTIEALEDVVIGSDVENDQLPACLIGDSTSYNQKTTNFSNTYNKNARYFVMILTENGQGSSQIAGQLLTDTVNALLYDETNNTHKQWVPDGYQYPFQLVEQQPSPIFDTTRTVRTLFFSFNESVK